MFIKYTRCLLIFLFVCRLPAQVNEWPFELYVPTPAEEKDSAKLIVNTRQTVFEKSFKSSNSLNITSSDSGRFAEQNAIFNMKRDEGIGTMNSYSNFGGQLFWNNVLFNKADLGLDWKPVIIMNSGSGGSGIEANLEIGPASKFNVYKIPVMTRAGFAARGWNDNLDKNIFKSGNRLVAEMNEDIGAYGGLRLGNYDSRIFRLPLYFESSIYGRITEDISRQFSSVGSILFAQNLPSNDSIFIFCTDSVSSGQEGFLSEEQYVSIPKRTANSLRLTGALKGKSRMHLKPSLIYSLAQYSVSYLDNPDLYNDKNNIRNKFNFLLHSDSLFLLDYKGGIGFEWEKENKLHNHNETADITTADTVTAAARANLRDYDGFKAMTRHELSKKWKNGFGLKYVFDISRYTKIYPNVIISNGDSIKVNEDYHWIVEKHKAIVNPFVTEKLKTELSGNIIKNTSKYLKKEFSIGNGEDRTYMAGFSFEYIPVENITISEKAIAKVERTFYSFPEKHADHNGDGRPDDPARYSRRFYSDFRVDWIVNEHLSFAGRWNQIYWDDGYWHGKEYFLENASSDIKEYYAIEAKSIDYELFFAANIIFMESFKLSLGGTFEDMNYQRYILNGFKRDAKGVGYILEPFGTAKILINNTVALDFSMKRRIHNLWNENLQNEVKDYWDIYLFFNFSL